MAAHRFAPLTLTAGREAESGCCESGSGCYLRGAVAPCNSGVDAVRRRARGTRVASDALDAYWVAGAVCRRLAYFFGEEPDIGDAGSFRYVDDLDHISVRESRAGVNEHVLVPPCVVDFLKL